MAGNYTLTIIKPDAFGAGKAGKIIAHLEQQGFKVLAARVMHLSRAQAGEFYAVHKERPFYNSLVSFMTSGPCMPMVLEKSDAVAALRTAIGATDPAQADAGTVRTGGYKPFEDADALRASGQYRTLTPEQFVDELKAKGPNALPIFHPMMGGIPPALAWESLRLIETEVLARL